MDGRDGRGCPKTGPSLLTAALRRATLLPILLCACCAPIPHQETLTPRFFGSVSQEGAPLAGAQVRVSRARMDIECRATEQNATTDGAGRFDIPAVTELRLFRSAFGDKYFTFFLCISVGQSLYAGHVSTGVGPAPDAVRLSCAIDKVSTPMPQDASISMIRKIAVCRQEF